MPQVSLDEMVSAIAHKPVLVSFPTDTVPALATKPEQANLIFKAKRRPPEKPLILMGATLSDLLPYIKGDVAEIAIWQSVAAQHWPGQLTLVLPASPKMPAALNPLGSGTLGIRVPNHPVALELLVHTGPLATTSSNLSGQPPLTNPADIATAFPTALTLPAARYKSETTSEQPSTVALWSPKTVKTLREQGGNTRTDWKILRQGEVRLQ